MTVQQQPKAVLTLSSCLMFSETPLPKKSKSAGSKLDLFFIACEEFWVGPIVELRRGLPPPRVLARFNKPVGVTLF